MPAKIIGPIKLEAIAHGGHCVARHEGRVIFVRGGIPGETVTAQITDDSKTRYWWAEVEKVISPSKYRVEPPCQVAGLCGGCDYQHINLEYQRQLKADVIAELFAKLAKIDIKPKVEAIPADDGLHWRTRMRYLSRDGKLGMRAWKSHNFVPLPKQGCLLADRRQTDLTPYTSYSGEIQVSVDSQSTSVFNDKNQILAGSKTLNHNVGDRRFQVSAQGFWQVHYAAAEVLSQAVMDYLQPSRGEKALDLYCGVGLFSGFLVDAGCKVLGVEANKTAINLAKQNVKNAKFVAARLEQYISSLDKHADIIVIDPPRSGAGRKVMESITSLDSRAICYVACDPAALARDVAIAEENGYKLTKLRAFDIFPMTHHVETVALLTQK